MPLLTLGGGPSQNRHIERSLDEARKQIIGVKIDVNIDAAKLIFVLIPTKFRPIKKLHYVIRQ
jgi:hypothetical protein